MKSSKKSYLKRTPLKRNASSLKRTALKKKTTMVKAHVDQKYLIDRKAEGQKMKDLFDEHWKIKAHVCESCGCKIYGENKTIYHDHLIDKSPHPELMYEIDNLLLVCFECHQKKTNGFPTEKHKEFIEKAKKQFNI